MLSCDDRVISIETNTEFQSILEEFICKGERMCFITVHLLPWAVLRPDQNFNPSRDNILRECEPDACSHQPRNSDNVTIPYRYNCIDDYRNRSTSVHVVVKISSAGSEHGDDEAGEEDEVANNPTERLACK